MFDTGTQCRQSFFGVLKIPCRQIPRHFASSKIMNKFGRAMEWFKCTWQRSPRPFVWLKTMTPQTIVGRVTLALVAIPLSAQGTVWLADEVRCCFVFAGKISARLSSWWFGGSQGLWCRMVSKIRTKRNLSASFEQRS